MALFLSTYTNRVDKKGRVSVPAPFRNALASQEFQGIVVFKSSNYQALEGFGWDRMTEMSDRLDQFDMFSNEQDDLASLIFGESRQLPFDGDGRILLPQELIEFCGISDHAAFVGMGKKFQIWAPELLEDRLTAARQQVQDKGLTLPTTKDRG
jgi:MraZ protein